MHPSEIFRWAPQFPLSRRVITTRAGALLASSTFSARWVVGGKPSPYPLEKDTKSETELVKALRVGSFAFVVFSVSFYIYFQPQQPAHKKRKYRERS